jgi:hypothetical protein
MKGLDFARVLVVDDDQDEASGMIAALRSQGIAVLYYTGAREELPREHFSGVRLAVLDLDLTGQSGIADAPNVVAPTAEVLAKLIDDKNGPYLALAWTKHPELLEALRVALTERGIPPVDLLPFEKSASKGADGKWDSAKISTDLENRRRASHPFQLLVEWEDAAYRSAVTTVLSMFGSGPTSPEVVGALGSASRASSATPSDLIGGIGEFLARFQADQLEAHLASVAADEGLIKRVRDGSQKPVDEQLRAKLNGKLLFALGRPGGSPGSIYSIETLKDAMEAPTWWPDASAVVKDFDHSGEWAKKIAESGQEPKGFAIEVTPACDEFRDRAVGRFVAGVALDSTKLSGKQREDLVKQCRHQSESIMLMPLIAAPWMFPEQPAALLWMARLYFTVPLPLVKPLAPVARLRHDALADVQDWLAGHANRPGFLSV